jgi:tetratricopeptide (TPR) repeat protein
MKPRSWTALVTCFAFAGAIFWPYAARAQQAQPAAPAPAPAAAAPSDDTLNQAKTHFEAGKNAYNAGDYQTAIREFKAAEALRPSPILDYNIGLANEKLGKKRVAVKYYRRYLEGMPNATNRPTVEASIAQLEREIAAQPPPSNPPPGTAEQPSDMPPPVAPSSQPPTYSSYDPYASTPPPYPVQGPAPQKKKSYWWVALIVIGGALLLTGIIVYVAVVYSSVATPTVADHALTNPPREPPRPGDGSQRSSGYSGALFTF